MKDYIYALIKLQSKLDDYCEKTDKALEHTALDTRRDTMRLVEEMERLIALKIKLVNLSVIHTAMVSGLSERECLALSMAADKSTLAEIAEELYTGSSSVARLLAKIKEKCARALIKCGVEKYTDILDRFA